MKLQGKMEMKNPHSALVLIPLRSWHVQKCSITSCASGRQQTLALCGAQITGSHGGPGQGDAKRESKCFSVANLGQKNYWSHASPELADQLAMKCDGECSLSQLASVFQPLAILSLPQHYLLLVKKTSFFMQMQRPRPCSSTGPGGHPRSTAFAICRLQV